MLKAELANVELSNIISQLYQLQGVLEYKVFGDRCLLTKIDEEEMRTDIGLNYVLNIIGELKTVQRQMHLDDLSKK